MRLLQLASLSLLVAAMSCSDAVGPHRQIAELEAAQQRWRAQNLNTYAFMLQRTCDCVNVNPLYVAVVNDTVVGVLDLKTGAAVDPQLGHTIEGLFTFVRRAIDRPADRIRVDYDGAKGFPSEIDYYVATEFAGNQFIYRISDVHPISPQT